MEIEGKTLNVTPCSFSEAMGLKRAIANALKAEGINLNLLGVSDAVKTGSIKKVEIPDNTIGIKITGLN